MCTRVTRREHKPCHCYIRDTHQGCQENFLSLVWSCRACHPLVSPVGNRFSRGYDISFGGSGDVAKALSQLWQGYYGCKLAGGPSVCLLRSPVPAVLPSSYWHTYSNLTPTDPESHLLFLLPYLKSIFYPESYIAGSWTHQTSLPTSHSHDSKRTWEVLLIHGKQQPR